MYKESNEFIKSALILSAAGFVVKIMSAAYRVPFQNIVGDIGFYIYQQIYPIYGIAAVLATSGFPIIISKLVAEDRQKDQRQLIYKLQAVFFTLLFIGISFFGVFFFGASTVAGWMGDPLLAPLIRTISFIFLFLPFLSMWRGYFQGKGDMKPTAVSQVAEQFARVIVILLLASLLVAKRYSLYDAGRGALVGSLVGAIVGVGLLTLFAVQKKIISGFFINGLTLKQFYRTAQIVLIHGTAICISGMVLILFQLIDSFSLYSLLLDTGITVDYAKSLKGVFDRGQPLIQLGTVAAASFSLVLVPLITTAWNQNKVELLRVKAQSAIKLSMIIGAGAAAGLANIIRPTNVMLFETASGSDALTILSVSIFFSSIILVCSGVLQGLGHVFTPSKYILIGLVFKWACNYFFIPIFGMMGAALATVCGLAIIAFLLVQKLHKRVDILPVIKLILPHLIFAVVLMTASLQIWQIVLAVTGYSGRIYNTFLAFSGVTIGAIVYLAVIIRKGLLTEEEMRILPFGSKLGRIGKKERRRY
ncbi:putative polysaccharide biosynthesis protein [Bacillus sp. FSL K6-3431]|uniref:putative polysaccharide biosynthesis protein n=1 Tax=Bacillus sp. FSL K6-3431 TaxID=2921500 RepID=UPI0030F6E92A